MRLRRLAIFTLSLSVALVLGAAPRASASTISFLLTTGAQSCVTLPTGCGTVTITDDPHTTGVVDVSVSLLDSVNGQDKFVETGGSHIAFGFNILNDPTLTVGPITPAVEVFSATGANSPSIGGAFDYNIDCTSCGNGNAGSVAGPLSFTVTDAAGLSVSSFVANTSGNFFAVDLIDFTGSSSGSTAEVNATTGTTTVTPVPEPSSLVLLASGLIAGAARLRRRFVA